MSIARHHVEWLSLLEVSGPFLSLPVLMKTFPQGLEGIEPHFVGSLRAGYEEWQTGVEKRAPSIQDNWVRFVLREILGIPDEAVEEGQAIPEAIRASFAEHGETLRPDLVIAEPSSKRRRLLVQVYPAAQDLEKAVRGKTWNASPATRMMELLHATGVRLGLVTNGERWMLVDAPRDETTGYASWYAGLWLEERITFQAFRSLLGAERFFNVPDDQTLESLLAESAEDQQEVTDQLGYQVRKAVEVLVEALDRADQDHSRALLADVAETELYEAALTVMMRLVFLFCAEERELLLLGEPLFDEHYAVSTLREQLREAADQHGEDVLERRHDAWNRLLATFRAVHGGIRHERLVIPPYGGTLLDPDRFPFLEGRKPGTTWRTTPAEPLPVNNRTVLHLLDALQVLQVRLPGGGSAEARKVSFRALDIEQIGYVYEGLLDHTAKRATEPTLGLGGSHAKNRDSEPEVPLSELEALLAKGNDALVTFLTDETKRSAAAIRKLLEAPLSPDVERRYIPACGAGKGGEALWKRVRPFFRLVRDDSFGYPVVIRTGSVYVTEGTDRRSSGTQYTPSSLTAPVVRHALEPLVYAGPAEGLHREKWTLRSAREILALKICDFACGSGAFLVQECRYLADRLIEAWEEIKRRDPSALRITPEGEVSLGLPEERLIPEDPDERLAFARRLVAQRCLYGVDVNPLAVEMTKLSLWLLTLAKDQPFTFLDHSIRCGDSLLGITNLEQLKRFTLADGPVQKTISQTESFDDVIDEAIAKRLRLEAIEGNTVEHVEAQKQLLDEAEEGLIPLKAAADQLIAAEVNDVSRDDAIRAVNETLRGQTSMRPPLSTSLRRRPFHWVLEFPEVMLRRGGFDMFVGNPPFLGGRRISFRLGEERYRQLRALNPWAIGTTDLCVYFLRRASTLLGTPGVIGLLLSDIVTQGDSRDSGLSPLLAGGLTLIHGRSSRHWPGAAGVKIVDCHLFKGQWKGEVVLDGRAVTTIGSDFRPEEHRSEPFPLEANAGLSFSGHYLMGQGFLITLDEARALVDRNARYGDVIFDYIKGDELNNEFTQDTGVKAINFGFRDLPELERDYPDALDIVRTRVKPERDLVRRQANRERWWRYAEARPGLAKVLEGVEQVILQPYTAKFIIPTPFKARCVFAHPLVVIVDPSAFRYGCLQSTIHSLWVWQYCATNLDLLAYTANRVLETFPFPPRTPSLFEAGAKHFAARERLRVGSKLNLNEIFNQLHKPGESSEDIEDLRELQIELDCAVAGAYGWSDLELGHDFHKTKQGLRLTVSESARREILDRLLRLNHERYAEEVKQGQHQKKAKRKRGGASEPVDGDESPLF